MIYIKISKYYRFLRFLKGADLHIKKKSELFEAFQTEKIRCCIFYLGTLDNPIRNPTAPLKINSIDIYCKVQKSSPLNGLGGVHLSVSSIITGIYSPGKYLHTCFLSKNTKAEAEKRGRLLNF
jgi:hypothetical protein